MRKLTRLGSLHGSERSRMPELTAILVRVERTRDAWEGCARDAASAYRAWRGAPDGQRPSAAESYFAALDREERAAGRYRLAWQQWRSASAT